MMSSPRPRIDVGSSRRHGNHLSISDPSHHVTEAIGTLYGDDNADDDHLHHHVPSPTFASDRPLSFVGGHPEMITHHQRHTNNGLLSPSSPTGVGGWGGQGQGQGGAPPVLRKSHTMPANLVANNQRTNTAAFEQNGNSPKSPTIALRDMDADRFSLTEMQDPTDIAQELSNLQALRRMSMDVGNNNNPDIPPFMVIPSLAPSGDDDENDLSRLLWVPARAHPEISPSEYQSFVKTKRRSGEAFLSANGGGGGGGGGGGMGKGSSLTRKKSMLSRQIVNNNHGGAVDYVDGADRLERKRSSSGTSIPELSLEELVNDPMKVVQRLTHPAAEAAEGQDVPILPAAPPGMGLRRSTRTTYRKGGSLKGERVPFAKRMALKQDQFNENTEPETTATPVPTTAPVVDTPAPPGHNISRVQSEPVTENFSRPNRSLRRRPVDEDHSTIGEDFAAHGQQQQQHAAEGGSQSVLPVRTAPIPQIVETAPAAADDFAQSQASTHQQPTEFPRRSSSQKATEQPQQRQPSFEEPPARSSKRPSPQPADSSSTPSPTAPTRAENLSFMPTIHHDDRRDKKAKKDDDSASVVSSKSTSSWRWFKSSSEDKERKKREEEAKKAKARNSAAGGASSSDKQPQDNVRLDVLESFDNAPRSRSRESQVMDRDLIDPGLVQADKKKDSSGRKSSGGEPKKEKDGLFSSLFGSTKKKGGADKDGGSSKKKDHHLRVVEDQAPYRPLVPDVDYPYSRFTLVEERAIYRMAHIKLANPRRPLHSQVLLSNFMYSYLAIVQAMHPQMNVPTSPQQRRLEEEQRRKEKEAQKQQEREAQKMAEQQLLQQQQQQQMYQAEHGEYDEYEYDDHDGGEYDDGQAYDEYGNPIYAGHHHYNGYDQPYDGEGEYYDDGHGDGHVVDYREYQQQQLAQGQSQSDAGRW